MKRLLSTLMAVCIIALCASASKTVKGKVVSAADNEPLIGATVQAVGSNQGTSTDINGEFTVTVNDNVTQLKISYVGYKEQIVAVSSNLTVALEEEDNTLEEVVVTAMGITRKEKSLGFAATAVKGDDIVKSRTSDVMSSLAGKVAGVQIAATSSDPGASNSVIIRGFSSLSGSNQPLYVVDGVPLNNSAVYSNEGLDNGFDFGNGANMVNPDDVDNMTVLKGAAATALYGSRAANGVILITTKSGKKQKGIGIEYNGGVQFENVLRLPQVQNDFGQGWYGAKTMDENGSWGPKFDGAYLRYGKEWNHSQQRKSYVAIPSNMKDFFDTGVRYNNSISFNGATNQSTYFLSLSQLTDDGIIPTSSDKYTKYTFSARASHRINKVMLSTSLNYAYNKNSFVTTGQKTGSMYNSIMQTPRDISIVELKDLSYPFASPGYYYTPYGVTNPYYILENYENKYEAERFYGKMQADYDFAKNFKLIYRFGLDTSTGHHNSGKPNLETLFAGTANGEDLVGETGSVTQQTTRRREINHDLMVTYDNSELTDWMGLNAVVGFNGNERKLSYLYSGITNLTIPTWYDLGNTSEKPEVDQYRWHRRLIGVYGQAEFAFKNQVFLTLTARNDWSSTLPKGNRSFFYPGVTLSWIFTELLPSDLRDWISYGKARFAWGKTGNDADVYMTQSIYGQASASSSGWGTSAFPFSRTGTNAYTAGNVLGSATLSPEMSTETEVGLNMAFFHHRLSFDFSWYNRISDKQIFSLNMDPATGYTAQNTNLGKIRNRGIELLINVTPVKIADFQWDLTWNFTKNNNKVLELPDEMGDEAAIYGFSGGTGLYAIEGDEMGVFKAYTSQRDPNGNVIVDDSGLPVKTGDVVKIGTMNYKYQMGFGTTLSYKGVSLGINFDYRKGGLMFSRTKDIQYFTGNAMQTAYNDRNPWIIPNSVVDNGDGTYSPNTTPLNPTNIYNYWNNGADEMDAAFLVDKTYLKLRSVTLTWDMPSQWFKNIFLTGVSVSLFGNNLWLWTPKSNTFIDPETTSFGNDLEGQFGEYSTNPTSRKLGFNVNIKF